ncbi:MAG: hypothetical protein ACWA5X_02350 [bacterium]
MNNKAIKSFIGLMLLFSVGLFATAGMQYFQPDQSVGPSADSLDTHVQKSAAPKVATTPKIVTIPARLKFKNPSHPITPEVANLPIHPKYLYGEEEEIAESTNSFPASGVILASMLGEPILIQNDFSTLADKPGEAEPTLKDSLEKAFLGDMAANIRKLAGQSPQMASVASQPVRMASAQPFVRVTTQAHPASPVYRYVSSFGGIPVSAPSIAGGSVIIQPAAEDGSVTPSGNITNPVPVPGSAWFLLSSTGIWMAYRHRRRTA